MISRKTSILAYGRSDTLLARSLFEDRGYRSQCRIWIGGKNTAGYPLWRENGRTFSVHRRIWEIRHGAIPKGMVICHKCDQPSCINIRHLFVGTQRDNMRDAMRKGRRTFDWNRGEKHPDCRFTDAQIAEIRSSNELQKVLAERFQTTQGYISQLRAGVRRKVLVNA